MASRLLLVLRQLDAGRSPPRAEFGCPILARGFRGVCELYRRWEGRLAPTMRQHHIAGEKLFVDYAGDTLDVVDPKTGEVCEAQLFVAVLGASAPRWSAMAATSPSNWPRWRCRGNCSGKSWA